MTSPRQHPPGLQALDAREPTQTASPLKQPPLPAVSWLLGTHVADALLRDALQSCLDQTFTDFELLVVANGPQAQAVADQVQQWFGQDPRLRVLVTPIRFLTFSLNYGLHHARAPLVARMDSDDVCPPDRLAKQVAHFNAHPEVSVLGSSYQIIDGKGERLNVMRLPLDDASIRLAMRWTNPLCHPSVMFKRQVVLEAGGYMGGLHAEDYDLWLRLSANPQIRFANLSDVGLYYRSQGIGPARRSRRAYASVASAQLRHGMEGQGWSWLLSTLMNVIKAVIRSRPNPKN